MKIELSNSSGSELLFSEFPLEDLLVASPSGSFVLFSLKKFTLGSGSLASFLHLSSLPFLKEAELSYYSNPTISLRQVLALFSEIFSLKRIHGDVGD